MRFRFNQKSCVYFLTIFAVLFLLLAFPSLLPFQSPEDNQATVEQNNLASQSATVASIYNNNMVIAGFSLIPVGGWIFLGFILCNTGVVVASYGQPITTLVLNPFVYIELSIYSYVVLRSIKLLHLFRQRQTKFVDLTGKQVVRRTTGVYHDIAKTVAYTLIVSCLALLASAFVEYMILRGTLG
jgi:hypothetical protein